MAFAGDNINDLCPALSPSLALDAFFPRRGFPVHKMVTEEQEKDLKCKAVCPWGNGGDILGFLKEYVPNNK